MNVTPETPNSTILNPNNIASPKPRLTARSPKESCRVRQFPPFRFAVAGLLAKTSSDRATLRHRFRRSGRRCPSSSSQHDENGLRGSDLSDQTPAACYSRPLRVPADAYRRSDRKTPRNVGPDGRLPPPRSGRVATHPHTNPPAGLFTASMGHVHPRRWLLWKKTLLRKPARPPRITASTPRPLLSRQTTKKARRKWHGSASPKLVGLEYQPAHQSGAVAPPYFGLLRARDWVLALSGTSRHGNRPTGGRSTAQIPATNLTRLSDVLASGIRISAPRRTGPSPCKSFRRADYGEYAAFKGRRTSQSGRRTSCVPWPVGGRLATACPPRSPTIP